MFKKKRKKQIVAVLLCLFMGFALCLPQMNVRAADENGFEVNEAGVLVAYIGPGGAITIPSTVTQIADSVFHGNTSITSVTIPDGVTHIGSGAFEECTNMGSLTVSSTVEAVGSRAFANCTSLSSVSYGSRVLPDSIFAGCVSLSSFNVASGTTAVGANAFANCSNLTSVSIPASVTTVNLSAFSGCSSLSSVSAGGGSYASSDGCLYNASMTRLLYCPPGKGSVSIPAGVTTISSGAFNGCRSLGSVSLPSSVTTIENGAFSNSAMTNITIPSSVTTIGSQSGWSVSLIKGSRGSAAETYANSAKIPFEATDPEPEEPPVEEPEPQPPVEEPEPQPPVENPGDSNNNNNNNNSGGSSKVTVTTGGSSGGSSYIGSTSGGSSIIKPETTGIDESLPTKTIHISDDQEPFTPEEMAEIIETNKEYNISFETDDGIYIKFAKGSMKLVDGIESYDFRVKLILKYDKRTVDAAEMTENNFAFELLFNYSGDLPATAYVYIPIGTRYSGSTIYYYTCSDGALTHIASGVVSEDGYLIVSQTHCSGFVGLKEGIHVKDGTPKTGIESDYRFFLIIALVAVGVYFIIVKRRRVAR